MNLKRCVTTLLCFALLSGLTVVSAAALSQVTYTAPCNTYYLNPDTGVTDDGGSGNVELGEGMCRSAIYESALIEVDGGKTYVTIRMQLMSNIRNVKFSVQETPGDPASYKSVTHSIMQEDASADTMDYRFETPRADVNIRCDMYVIPMSRDVVYYMNVAGADAKTGSADFVTSVTSASDKGAAVNGADTAGGISGQTANGGVSSDAAADFTDMDSHWARNAVSTVVQRGLFAGTSDTTFGPDASMTRAMFVTVMGRLSGVDATQYTQNGFSDVDSAVWYGPYVAWAAENDIVNGTGNGAFSPDRAITQQEMAVMVQSYINFRTIALKSGSAPLANQSAAADWAQPAVTTLAEAGLITDNDGGAFAPAQPATRAQVAAVLDRYLKLYDQ